MKALSGQLNAKGELLEGVLTYNGYSVESNKFILQKIVNYVSEHDVHHSLLTVQETLEFAWRCTTGGNHSYGIASDTSSAKMLDANNEKLRKV